MNKESGLRKICSWRENGIQRRQTWRRRIMADYIWNPPKWTEEELRRSIEANAERIRRAAKGWDVSGEWQRAMGVTPKE